MSINFVETGQKSRERSFAKFVTVGDEPQHYEVEVRHSQGGMNYLAHKTEARGFYASVCPIERGENWTTYTGFSGTKILLEENKRFNRKRFDQLVDEVFDNLNDHPTIELLYKDVVNKNGNRME